MTDGKEDLGTDVFFVPYGLVAGAIIAWLTYNKIIGPAAFWGAEAVFFFISVFLIFSPNKGFRGLAHVAMIVLTLIGGAEWILHMAGS